MGEVLERVKPEYLRRAYKVWVWVWVGGWVQCVRMGLGERAVGHVGASRPAEHTAVELPRVCGGMHGW